MSEKIISMEELKESMPPGYIYLVDTNKLLGACGASPVHMYFEANKVYIRTLYPKSIQLTNGTNDICITQITKVVQDVDEDEHDTFKIDCGYTKPVETTVKITKYNQV